MPSRVLRSPLALVVLGLLAEQPLHPYAMRVLMRERGHDRITRRGSASVYDTVERLAAAGMVEVQESVRTGRRPERTVYRVTVPGLDALRSWVTTALADSGRSEEFTAALSFMYVLPRREVLDLLSRRRDDIATLIDTLQTEEAEALAADVPEIFLSEGRYHLAMLRAQRDWLETFTTSLETGEPSWPSDRTTQEEPS